MSELAMKNSMATVDNLPKTSRASAIVEGQAKRSYDDAL